MNRRILSVIALAALVSLTPLAEAKNGSDDSVHHRSGSDDSNKGGSDRSKEVRAKNSFVRGKFRSTSPLVKARFERRVRAKRGGVEEDRMRGWVKLGVPTASVNVNDLDQAAAAAVVMSFHRAGVEYANCTLAFDHIDDEDGVISAEYKLDLRNRPRKNKLEVKKGSCDSDLTVPGAENTIPDVLAGDTMKVSINGVANVISGVVQ